jgi:hypothetical protein
MNPRKWQVVKINRRLWTLSVEGEHPREGYREKRICYQLARILGLNPANEQKAA